MAILRRVLLNLICSLVALLAQGGTLAPRALAADAPSRPAWKVGQSTELQGAKITLSQPVLVMRDAGYLWFPTIIPLSSGKLLAMATNYSDTTVQQSTCLATFSSDKGLTWSKPVEAIYGDEPIQLPNGDALLMPYHLQTDGSELVAPGVRVTRKYQELTPEEIRIGGLPKPVKIQSKESNIAGFWFNGQAIELKRGGYLGTIHGYFEGDKRLNLVNLESPDGKTWIYRSVIAAADCPLEGADGPCESALVRMKDGRLLCVFRMGAQQPLGQAFSADEGKTWTEAAAMKGPRSVQPALAVLKDGTLVLTTGRPGLWAWFDFTGEGEQWQPVDLLANHNEFATGDFIKVPQSVSQHQTSSYTQVIAISPTELLVIYDRIPHGWSEPPAKTDETNSVWVVKIEIQSK